MLGSLYRSRIHESVSWAYKNFGCLWKSWLPDSIVQEDIWRCGYGGRMDKHKDKDYILIVAEVWGWSYWTLISVVFLIKPGWFRDSTSSPSGARGLLRTLAMRVSLEASNDSSENQLVFWVAKAVCGPWPERLKHGALLVFFFELGQTLTISVARGRWMTGMQAQMIPTLVSMMLHSIMVTLLSVIGLSCWIKGNWKQVVGVRINIQVRSGSMEACSNDARKQLTTRTLAKVRRCFLHLINRVYSQRS